jgi:hypothetical protein
MADMVYIQSRDEEEGVSPADWTVGALFQGISAATGTEER